MKTLFLFPTLAEVPKFLRTKKIEPGCVYPYRSVSMGDPLEQIFYHAISSAESKALPSSIGKSGTGSGPFPSLSGRAEKTENGYKFLCVGPGSRVRKIVSQLRNRHDFRSMILIGYAGALSPSLKPGSVAICDRYMAAGRPTLHADQGMCRKMTRILQGKDISPIPGASYTVKNIVNHQDIKRSLHRKGACIVEMENYWAALCSRELGIPLVSIRVVLDSFEEQLPDLSDTVSPEGDTPVSRALRHLWEHPGHLWPMLKIFFHSGHLLGRIGDCVEAVMNAEWTMS